MLPVRLVRVDDIDGNKPIMIALSEGSCKAFRMLNHLDTELSIASTRSKDGKTLVHLAVLSDKPEMLMVGQNNTYIGHIKPQISK